MQTKGKNCQYIFMKNLGKALAYQNISSFLSGYMPSVMCTFAVCLLTYNNVAFLLWLNLRLFYYEYWIGLILLL